MADITITPIGATDRVRDIVVRYGFIAITVLLFVFFAATQPQFAQVGPIFAMLKYASVTAILGLAVMFSMIVGGLDLSRERFARVGCGRARGAPAPGFVRGLAEDLLQERDAPPAAGPGPAAHRELTRHLRRVVPRPVHQLPPRHVEAITHLIVQVHQSSSE